ncbi:MAG: ABC transporter substrate-binding protein [Bdellovibrio sp.]|nr:ABC transporter substrate-binding protein [Bdellovibrio sp.]
MSEKARIISLVPSWTETLLEAGVLVVGCTQFCIHPIDKISSISKVGGTKNMNLEKILQLKPDFVILDEQENKLEMAEELKRNHISLLISNVTDLQSVEDFLITLGEALSNEKLIQMAGRYQKLNLQKINKEKFWQQIFILGERLTSQSPVDYVIWRKPFMVIGKNTFIAENLKFGGIELIREEKYPKVSEADLKKSFCLFSSEPYPFAKHFDSLKQRGMHGALVDGEKLSWYGIRNLNFLERCLE